MVNQSLMKSFDRQNDIVISSCLAGKSYIGVALISVIIQALSSFLTFDVAMENSAGIIAKILQIQVVLALFSL